MISKKSSQIPYASLIFLLGIIAVVCQYIVDGNMPGDAGDSRFNMFVLEHFFRALTGQEQSFSTAAFFYPLQNTILFSDNHWGTGLIYALPRWLGANMEKSYALWFLSAFILNYWAAFYVLRKLELSSLSSAIGAFLFTFSLPVIAMDGHSQLLSRPFIPLAFLAAYDYTKSRDFRYLALTFLLLALQLLTSVYNGVFLLFLLLAFFAVDFFLLKEKRLKKFLPKKFSAAISLPILALGAAIFLLFALPYLETARLYNFDRSWHQVIISLPRVASFFLSDRSLLWFSDLKFFADIPQTYREEHQMFIGIGGVLALLILYFTKDFLKNESLAFRTGMALAIVIIMTLFLYSISLYPLLMLIPGTSALRVVSREILVLLFPISYLVGLSIEKIKQRGFNSFSSNGIIAIICILIIIDPILAKKSISRVSDWNLRMREIDQKITLLLNPTEILAVATQNNDDEIDVMLYAQEMGVRTLNGYTGNYPDYVYAFKTVEDVDTRISSIEKFMHKNSDPLFKFDREKIIYVGFPESCKSKSEEN